MRSSSSAETIAGPSSPVGAPTPVTPPFAEQEQVGTVAARPARKIRVLIVDDQLLLRSGLQTLLADVEGIEVVGEAATIAEAVAALNRCQPDVVLIDLDIPGDCIVATATITARDPHPAVLVVTTHPEDDHLVDALRAGASGYLSKNVTEPDLARAIGLVAAGDVYVGPGVASLLAAELRRPGQQRAMGGAYAKYQSLSQREQIVLRLVAEGYSGPEIGRSLGIRAKTVDTYRQRIQQKIGLGHRTEYIRFALKIDLLRK